MNATETLIANLQVAKKQAEADLERIVRTIKAFGGSITDGRLKVGRRKLSAKARKAIGDAQRKRWAATRKTAKKGKQARLPAAPNA